MRCRSMSWKYVLITYAERVAVYGDLYTALHGVSRGPQ